MSDLVGNPEDRFSHNEAHLMFVNDLIEQQLYVVLPLVQMTSVTAHYVNHSVLISIPFVHVLLSPRSFIEQWLLTVGLDIK